MPLVLPEEVITEKNKHEQESPWLLLLKLTNVAGDLTVHIVNNNEDITYKGTVYTATAFEIDTIPEVTKGSLPTLAIKVTNVDRMLQGLIEQDATFGSGWDVKLSLIHMSQANNELQCSGTFTETWILDLYRYELNRCPSQSSYDYWENYYNSLLSSGVPTKEAKSKTTASFIKAAVDNGETFEKAEIEQDWVSLDIVASADILTINLGIQNPLHIQFPKQKYQGTFCQRSFDGPGCPYSRDVVNYPDKKDPTTGAPFTYCNKTLHDCKLRFSESRTNSNGNKIGLPYLAFNGMETRAIYNV